MNRANLRGAREENAKEAFMEYYGARRWKQHWDWQHERTRW